MEIRTLKLDNARFILPLTFLLSCCSRESADNISLFTRMSSEETGISFINKNTESPEQNILNYEYFYNGGGVAIGDINNDGLPDIYFSANQEENKLYLNKGNFKFEDITEKAGVSSPNGWRTGVAMADVNGDGYLDIYLCRSAGNHPLYRINSLFINNKDLTFTDRAKEYGLDDDSFSTQGAFLDYDRDGDLDLFLLNHSRLTISNAYDISKRSKTGRIRYVGNKFYRNDRGKFKDVSDSLGIFGPASNYGLGVAYGDVNNDGWIDLFTSNDYTEKDKMYINDHGKTFRDVTDSVFTHISQFSMGIDIADVNNDGWNDIISLDMLPADNQRQKEFHWPEKYDVYQTMVKNGLHHQYMRNMLQINNGDGTFSEIGQLAGISNTDWSWAALIADYDNDGLQDLFVSNGFKRNFTSNDFLKYTADLSLKIKQGRKPGELEDILGKMPSNKVHPYLFRNTDGISFEDVSAEGGFSEKGLSNGAAYADLDGDGDLDLVTNCLDGEAGIYRNNTSGKNFLKVKLVGNNQNTSGLGSVVHVFLQGKSLMRTACSQRGFQSSVEPVLHFGLGANAKIDSVVVVWATGERQAVRGAAANQILTLKQDDAALKNVARPSSSTLFLESKNAISFRHEENNFIDFKVQSLLPRMYSKSGPAMAQGDVNGDGVMDLLVGGAKGQSGELLIGDKNGKYSRRTQKAFFADALSEDVDAIFFDMDQDKDQDLYVVSGGYEFAKDDVLLQDRMYENDGKGNFTKRSLPQMLSNGSCVTAGDLEGDGDVDLFVGGSMIPGRYPEAESSVILVNDGKGNFSDETENVAAGLTSIGITLDATWADINGDNQADLIIVGEWMPVVLYINKKGKLEQQLNSGIDSRGWWNCVEAADFDGDGDQDLITGNFGMNNQFKATAERPVTLYYDDFDKNGSVDPLLNYYIGNKSYPSATRDELTDQLPSFKKKFPNYASYVSTTIDGILSNDELSKAKVLKSTTFNTMYWQNDRGTLVPKQLPSEIQFAPITAISISDLNGDGHLDFIAAGNLSGGRARFGKATGNYGSVFLGDGHGAFSFVPALQSGICVRGDVKKIVQHNGRFVFAINNDVPVVYELNRREKTLP